MPASAPASQFNAKGQNDKINGGGIQNRGGKLITIAPKEAANGQAGMADEALSGSRVTRA